MSYFIEFFIISTSFIAASSLEKETKSIQKAETDIGKVLEGNVSSNKPKETIKEQKKLKEEKGNINPDKTKEKSKEQNKSKEGKDIQTSDSKKTEQIQNIPKNKRKYFWSSTKNIEPKPDENEKKEEKDVNIEEKKNEEPIKKIKLETTLSVTPE